MSRTSLALSALLFTAYGCASAGRPESPVVKVEHAATMPAPTPSGPCSASLEGVLEAAEVEGKTVHAILVCGLPKTLRSEDVLAYVRMKPGHLLKTEHLASDVRALFDSGFFHRVDVVARGATSGAVDLELHLALNPAVRELAIEGAPHLAEDDDVHKHLKVGSVVSRHQVKTTASALRERYVAAGFEEANVTPTVTPAGEGGVRVVIAVNEGTRTTIGVVKITGLPRDLEAEVRRIEYIAPGTALSDYALLLARTAVGSWFNAHGYLEATGKLERGARAADGTAPIEIEMSEGPRYKLAVVKLAFGDAALEAALKKQVRVRPGEPYDRDKIREDVERMNEALRARGRKDIVSIAEQDHSKKRTVDLAFTLSPPET